MLQAASKNIGPDVSQLHLSLSACPDRTISDAARSYQSHKSRVRMLRLLRIPRRIAKIKKPSSRPTTSGSSGGRQQWDPLCGLSN
ncbi:hypothetical protein AXF42_Ash007970 [Apostasia shenzhenica]|uniref:Uncharacterized protein n=1 Tax=Apostasia shenzhenica TaxID=1088818 RepID=A0A2I0B5U9_9ASPA|nr:hypothetical protein AXF42_Ash007970 [Apostasia shenzhenica]